MIHSLPYFRGGLDATHGSTSFLPLSLDVTRTCCPFKQGVHNRTQGTLVPVTGQLIPSPGHGCQEVQGCTSWRAVAHFKQSNQDTPQFLERHSFPDGFHSKISAGHVAAFQGVQGSLLESLSRKAAVLHVSRAVLCYVMNSMRTHPTDSTPLWSLKSQLCCALNHSAARKSRKFRCIVIPVAK